MSARYRQEQFEIHFTTTKSVLVSVMKSEMLPGQLTLCIRGEAFVFHWHEAERVAGALLAGAAAAKKAAESKNEETK